MAINPNDIANGAVRRLSAMLAEALVARAHAEATAEAALHAEFNARQELQQHLADAAAKPKRVRKPKAPAK